MSNFNISAQLLSIPQAKFSFPMVIACKISSIYLQNLIIFTDSFDNLILF